MEFKSGRKAEIERSQIREGGHVELLALDRLALALSIAAGPLGEEPFLNAADGARHDTQRLDSFKRQHLFEPVLSALSGSLLDPEELRDAFRSHLNRGYDLLFRAFERHGKDWDATLVNVLPRTLVARRGGVAGQARPIRFEIGRDARDGRPLSWLFNREGGGQPNSNVRLVGMPGVGKSQVLLLFLTQLVEQSPESGFVLLDYKGDLSGNRDFVQATNARVIQPGQECIPINPFQLPATTNTALVPRAFAETFRTLSTRIGPVQESLLVKAMERCFLRRSRGAGEGGPENEPLSKESGSDDYPTLKEVVAAIEEVYHEDGRSEDSVLAILRDVTRYNLFADRCERPLSSVFSARWIIDLASAQTLRNFVAFVLLEFLHQVARSLLDAAYDANRELRQVRGVIAIDEAHYYLRGQCQPLLDLIRIGRSKGVPVFLSSQSLEDFRADTEVNEFLANTFVFKHGMPPDRRTISGALHLAPAQAADIAGKTTELEKFHAFANLPSDDQGANALLKVALRGFWERTTKEES